MSPLRETEENRAVVAVGNAAWRTCSGVLPGAVACYVVATGSVAGMWMHGAVGRLGRHAVDRVLGADGGKWRATW